MMDPDWGGLDLGIGKAERCSACGDKLNPDDPRCMTVLGNLYDYHRMCAFRGDYCPDCAGIVLARLEQKEEP